MSSVNFNNCSFENCNININNIDGDNDSSSSVSNPIAGLVAFSGIALALNPALLGVVMGTALIGAKGLALGGLGYSALKGLSILKENIQEIKTLEVDNNQEYIETTFRVKELNEG